MEHTETSKLNQTANKTSNQFHVLTMLQLFNGLYRNVCNSISVGPHDASYTRVIRDKSRLAVVSGIFMRLTC